MVARVDRLDAENYSEFATFVENYGEEFSKYFGKLLILYDSVSTEELLIVYDLDNIERTIKNLMDVVNSISSETSRSLMLIVLPSDVYNALNEEVRNALEGYRLYV